jgi:hypothetical protein
MLKLDRSNNTDRMLLTNIKLEINTPRLCSSDPELKEINREHN